MPRKKKIHFKLSPDWMFSQPLDFEYNKYTLLSFLQKCEQNFEDFKIYPDFVELSLHLANVQSLFKEKTILFTNKKFESCDDEILMKELIPHRISNLSSDEDLELTKTLAFSGDKLMDIFNIGKSIWSIVYESTDINLKKNKKNLGVGMGYVYIGFKTKKTVYLWEYSIKKIRGTKSEAKIYFNLIWEGNPEGKRITTVINENTTWGEYENQKQLPVFEVHSNENFPFDATLIPMIKRKLLSYILQSVPKNEWDSFDSLKKLS
jgi:hypothetical protein